MNTTKYLLSGLAALMLALPAAASADYSEGDYKGTNSQGRPMILTVGEGKVLRYGQSLQLSCRQGKRKYSEGGKFTTRVAIEIAEDGSFAAKSSRNGFKPSISGRIEGTHASGRFRLSFKRQGRSCSSPLVTWSADLLGS